MFRILAAVDDDRRRAGELVDAVERLAEDVDDLSATLLHVVRNVEVPASVSVHQPTENYEDQLAEAQELPVAVKEAAERLGAAEFDADVQIESGRPSQVIIDAAETGAFDSIYIGGRKNSPVGKVLFGSVVQAVLLNTSVPVTVIGRLE